MMTFRLKEAPPDYPKKEYKVFAWKNGMGGTLRVSLLLDLYDGLHEARIEIRKA